MYRIHNYIIIDIISDFSRTINLPQPILSIIVILYIYYIILINKLIIANIRTFLTHIFIFLSFL
jgi:hypothetical protein